MGALDMKSVRHKDRSRYASSSCDKKQEKINRKALLKELRRNTPSQRSIAKENPQYNPIDVVVPMSAHVLIGDSIHVDFSSLTEAPSDGQPPSVATPDEIHVGDGSTRRRKKNVTPGQRPALLAHRNTKFESRCAMQCPQESTSEACTSSSISCDTEIVNSEAKTTDISYVPSIKSRQVDECGDKLIFEKDNSEEGYMFPGQCMVGRPVLKEKMTPT